MQRCPNCRARDPGMPNCRRCGMALTQLQAVQSAKQHLIRSALAQLSSGNTTAAHAALQRASTLQHDPLVGLLLGFVTSQGREPPRDE